MNKENERKRYCWRFWPFSKDDYDWVADYLTEQERKGLRLCSIGENLSIAKYEKVTPKEARYEVALLESKEYTDIAEYLELCEDAGWKILWQSREWKIFRAKEEADPAPLETDPVVQAEKMERWLRKRRNNTFGALILFLVFNMIMIKMKQQNPLDFYLAAWSMQFYRVMLITFTFVLAFDLIKNWMRWRRAVESVEQEMFCQSSNELQQVRIYCLLRRVMETIFTIMLIGGILLDAVTNDGGIGQYIGVFIGMGIASFFTQNWVEGDYPARAQMQGLPTKRQRRASLALLCICCMLLAILPAPFKQEWGKQNYYLSSMKYSQEYYGPGGSGDAWFTARDRHKADRLEELLDKAIQKRQEERNAVYAAEDTEGPKGGAEEADGRTAKEQQESHRKGQRQVWTGEQLEQHGFGEYDEACYYSDISRLMLRQGNRIYLTNLNQQKETASHTVAN